MVFFLHKIENVLKIKLNYAFKMFFNKKKQMIKLNCAYEKNASNESRSRIGLELLCDVM